jgi:biotin transport system permease protein
MDWNQAANTVLRILVMVMLADLVTMTTPLQRLLDLTSLLFAPLDRLGNIRRQLGFAVALMIRFVPLLAQQWDAQRCAYRARTSRRPKPFLLAAFLSQALRRTDQIAESIAAREAKKRPLR